MLATAPTAGVHLRLAVLLAAAGLLLMPGAAQADTWVTSATNGVAIHTNTTTGKVGIGLTGATLPNRLDVAGGTAIGSYAGTNTAPSNGLIVSGGVGIGTTTLNSGEKLSVAGNIATTGNLVMTGSGNITTIGTISATAGISTSGTVTANGGIKVKTWSMEVPDYVFDADHRTMALADVESYVKANKHLPEVPSARELGAQGMDLAAMNLILLKKVEELTLYVIAQDKKITALQTARAR